MSTLRRTRRKPLSALRINVEEGEARDAAPKRAAVGHRGAEKVGRVNLPPIASRPRAPRGAAPALARGWVGEQFGGPAKTRSPAQ